MTDIPFSRTYLHELKELTLAREEGRLTEEEFSKRVDELREREFQGNPELGHWLMLQTLIRAEREIEDEVKEKAQQAKQEAEAKDRAEQMEQRRQSSKQRQAKIDEEEKELQRSQQRESDRQNFRTDANNYVDRLENSAKSWQSRYTWLQIILLLFSAGTTAMASIDGLPRWIVSISGLVATVAGGLLTTFKIQDRIYASRRAVAEVKLECQKYDYRIEEYKDTKSEEEVFLLFSNRLSVIQGQEMLQEVELWNPKKEEKSVGKSEPPQHTAMIAESKDSGEKQLTSSSENDKQAKKTKDLDEE